MTVNGSLPLKIKEMSKQKSHVYEPFEEQFSKLPCLPCWHFNEIIMRELLINSCLFGIIDELGI